MSDQISKAALQDGGATVVNDGLTNLVANLGTDRDKASFSTYTAPILSDYEIVNAYRGASLPRKIVDLPVDDAVSEWREWQADATQISAIEAEEKRLGLKRKLKKAIKRARLTGGALIIIGDGAKDTAKPLDPQRIKRGGLKYLTVLSKNQVSIGAMDQDATSPTYGEPAEYRVAGSNNITGEVVLHPSRVAAFIGCEIPDDTFTDGWGDSVLVSTLEDVKKLDSTAGNIASLVFEAKVDVLGIPDFMQNLKNGGATYEKQVIARASLAHRAKGINGTLLKDAAETYDQKSASFATLPDILDRFMVLVSAAAEMPVTKLFGKSTSGLNTKGEGDEKNYNKKVAGIQSDATDSMSILDECLIYSALGSRPEEIHYNWRALSMPSAKEKAEIANKTADAFKKVNDMDLGLPDDIIAKAVVNAFTEIGIAGGLEADLHEHFGSVKPDGEGDDDDNDGSKTVTDAAPQTLYVSRQLLNASEVIRWAKSQGFKTTLPADDMHVTIAFSRQPVDWMECGTSWQPKLEIPAGGPRQMEQFGDARVLLFTDDDLVWRHRRIIEAGATWDHPEYQPHLTISYDADAPDVADIEPYQGPFVFGPEIFAKVKDDWMEGVKEK